MIREKQLEDRRLRPLVNAKAADRFIKHGLYDRNDKKRSNNEVATATSQQPKNKKIRFPENDSD